MGRNLLPALPQLGQPRQSVAPFDSVERDALCMRITFEPGRRRVVFHVLKANARSYRQNGERPLHETTCANSVHCSNVSGAEKFRPKLPYIRRAQTLTALAVVSLFTRRHYRPLPGDRGGGLAGWRSARSFTVDGEAAVVGADAVFDA